MSRISERAAALRRFSRFYTKHIGALQEALLRSSFSLTEARVLYELAHRHETTATELGQELGLDHGYLSRVLRRFQKSGLLEKRPSADDGRRRLLTLTERGRDEFAGLNAASQTQAEGMLRDLSEDEQQQLVQAMDTIERILGDDAERRVPYLLRPHQPGDMGWVVQQHGKLYNREYGWNEEFEGLVAGIVSTFIRDFDPSCERCWIAEKEGENVGSVFLIKKKDDVAQLRLLLVLPEARGLGIGRRLTQECTRFARQVGYRKIVLWTNSVLHAARHIYEGEGYRLVEEEPHHSFGHDLVGQYWELEL
jgi:DNA-binding MarR family transcriptional regulator/GNAT superfamily N-acetyltransferase